MQINRREYERIRRANSAVLSQAREWKENFLTNIMFIFIQLFSPAGFGHATNCHGRNRLAVGYSHILTGKLPL